MNETPYASQVRPLGIRKAILFFGLPSIFLYLFFWKAMPLLDWLGIRLFATFAIGFGITSVLLLLLTLRFYRKEGWRWSSHDFRNRLRLGSIDRGSWLWTAGLIVFMYVSTLLLAPTADWLMQRSSPPKFWARILEPDRYYFMEVRIHHNIGLVLGYMGILLFNIFAGELWWRGCILPRQEIAHGKRAWLIHGVFWHLYESFMIWQFFQILPTSLAIPYVVQRRQNTWCAVIARIALSLPLMFSLLQRSLL
jgi:hypothetical protein